MILKLPAKSLSSKHQLLHFIPALANAKNFACAGVLNPVPRFKQINKKLFYNGKICGLKKAIVTKSIKSIVICTKTKDFGIKTNHSNG